jgi:hypothetical protein
MRPIFTLHAGEFLVGQHIERSFREKNVWVPTKDIGVDLLVTNAGNTKAVSLQVKFSRDFLPIMKMAPSMRKGLRACNWYTLDRDKIAKSIADFWVFVLMGFDKHSVDHAVIKPAELIKRLNQVDKAPGKAQVYIWVTAKNRCWLTRGLKREEQEQIALDTFQHTDRDLTPYLNNWTMISSL